MERMSKGREQALLAEYQASVGAGRPNLEARNEVAERHLPLVKSAARSLWLGNQQHVELDDLVQAGFVGLIEAIERGMARALERPLQEAHRG